MSETHVLEDVGTSTRTKPITYVIQGECWIQTYSSHAGTAYVTRFGKNFPLVRYITLLYLGEPLDFNDHNYNVKRSCNNPECVRPEHLRWERGSVRKKDGSDRFIREVFSNGRTVREYSTSHGDSFRTREGYGEVERSCSKCNEWKDTNLFSKRRGALTYVCSLCDRFYKRIYYRKNKAELSEKSKIHYKENKERINATNREYRRKNKLETKKVIAAWHLNNPGKKQGYIRKREVMSALLGYDLTTIEYEEHNNQYFNGGCALTGVGIEETHIEHFIPSSIGHGDTSVANCYPLEKGLNYSKNKSNPFEWIKREDVRKQISMEKWDRLVSILASKNNLSTSDFKEYVYWCFDNPRTIEDLKEDNTPSLELWRRARFA